MPRRLPPFASAFAPACFIAAAILPMAGTAHAEIGAAEVEDANAIVVSARSDSYHVDTTASATKTATPLLDVPQSVTVITRQQLDDQALGQLGEALRYVPGVTLAQGEGHRDQITLRGQSTTADFYLDGLRDDAQYYRSLFNTERVEVLKGANAMIFGRGGGGGVVNRVSKLARFDAVSGELSAGIDSFGTGAIAGDYSLPLSNNAAMRLNADYEVFANHRDVFGGHFIGIAPTLGLKPSDKTQVVLGYEYDEDIRVTDRGVPSLNGLPITGYAKTFFGSPALNQSKVKAHIARARIEHQFSDSLSANFTGLYATYDKFYANVLPSAATATTVTLTGYDNGLQRSNWIGQGNLVWKGETRGLRHTLLVGFELSNQDSASTRRDVRFATTGGGLAASTTVALARTIMLPAISFTALVTDTTSRVQSRSIYVQDQIELGEHVQIVGGLRRDWFDMTSVNRLTAFAGKRSDGKWSPRLGLIIKPQKNLSIYASYARSFLPQSGDQFSALAASTVGLEPEEFRNIEAGVKWDMPGGISFTGAVFQIDRANTRLTDPANSGFFLLSGKSRVRGLEAAISGRVLPQLQVSMGYSHQTGEILSAITNGTTLIPAGRKLAQLPNDQFSAWSRYDLSKKLGVGLGLIHQEKQFATISNAVTLPAFTRLDAAVYYNVSSALSLQLNVENLTDTRYYPSSHTDFNIASGEPINARLTARVKF